MLVSSSVVSLSIFCLAVAQDLTIRAQLGPYPVSISEHEIRTNRSDPLAPTPTPRRLMVTVYQPQLDVFACTTENQVNIPYVPDAVAAALEQYQSGPLVPAEAWESLRLINCSQSAHGTASSSSAPIVLFSHALQGSRYIYASSLQAVASAGYTVVAIDHTYDAVAVVFPDGYVAPTNVSTVAAYDRNQTYIDTVYGNFLTPIRIADAISVLDAIQYGHLPGFQGRQKSLEVAMFGHSAGGNTATGALNNDSRIISAMNVDGDLTGFVRNLTITKPYVMLGEENVTVVHTWPSFYQNNVRGFKARANVNNTVHVGFTDAPMVIDALGIRKNLTANEIAAFIGTIDSRRNLEIQWRLTIEWLDFVFTGKQPKLLEAPSKHFPDIKLAIGKGQEHVLA